MRKRRESCLWNLCIWGWSHCKFITFFASTCFCFFDIHTGSPCSSRLTLSIIVPKMPCIIPYGWLLVEEEKPPIHLISKFLQVGEHILGGGFKYFLFSPLPGEDFQFDYIIFFRWVETTNQSPVELANSFPSDFFRLEVWNRWKVPLDTLVSQDARSSWNRQLGQPEKPYPNKGVAKLGWLLGAIWWVFSLKSWSHFVLLLYKGYIIPIL